MHVCECTCLCVFVCFDVCMFVCLFVYVRATILCFVVSSLTLECVSMLTTHFHASCGYELFLYALIHVNSVRFVRFCSAKGTTRQTYTWAVPNLACDRACAGHTNGFMRSSTVCVNYTCCNSITAYAPTRAHMRTFISPNRRKSGSTRVISLSMYAYTRTYTYPHEYMHLSYIQSKF